MIKKVGIFGNLITSVPIFLFVCGLLGAQEYEIKYYAPKAEKVNIAGEFNNWNPDEIEMEKGEDGFFRKNLKLTPGVHEYKVIIDGEWLEGANLKYDTSLRKTIITSNFTWSPRIFWKGKFLINASTGSLINFYSLQGNITLNKNVSGAFLLTSCGIDGEWNTKAEKLYISFDKGGLQLMPFYNSKVVQSDDPLKILMDGDIPLRKEEINFYDEKNEQKNFGLGSQGILIKYGNTSLFVSEDYSNEEDLVFARAGFKNIGLGYALKKGIKFQYANDSNWFPDPEQPPTWQGNQNVQPWYKGFNEEHEAEMNFNREFDFIDIFGQYCIKSAFLHANRWDEGKNKDTPLDKKWRFYDSKKYLMGVKLGGPVTAEYSYFLESGKFSEFWDFEPRIEKQQAIIRANVGNSYIGGKVVQQKNRAISAYDVDESFDPYLIKYYFDMQKRYDSWKEYWLIVNFKGRADYLKAVGKFLPEEKLKEIVITAEKNISILSLKFSPRYFSYQKAAGFCYSLSCGVKIRKIFLEAGTGISPESFSLPDEDDRREDFLYNGKDIKKAQDELKKQERIWLRAVLNF